LPVPLDCNNFRPTLPQCSAPDVAEVAALEVPRPCQFQDGEDILDFYSFNPDNLVRDVCLLIALAVGMRVLGFITLYARAYRKG